MNEIYRRSCCNDVCENALDDGATAAAEAKNIGARGILVSHLTVLTIYNVPTTMVPTTAVPT